MLQKNYDIFALSWGFMRGFTVLHFFDILQSVNSQKLSYHDLSRLNHNCHCKTQFQHQPQTTVSMSQDNDIDTCSICLQKFQRGIGMAIHRSSCLTKKLYKMLKFIRRNKFNLIKHLFSKQLFLLGKIFYLGDNAILFWQLLVNFKSDVIS